MTFVEGVWRPAPEARIRFRSQQTADLADWMLKRLVDQSVAQKEERGRTCKVRDVIAIRLRAGGSRWRAAGRAAFISGMADPRVDSGHLEKFLRTQVGLEWSVVPSVFDISDHRNHVCPCFRDPAGPRPRNRIDYLEADADRLQRQVDKLVLFVKAAWAGAGPTVDPDPEGTEINA